MIPPPSDRMLASLGPLGGGPVLTGLVQALLSPLDDITAVVDGTETIPPLAVLLDVALCPEWALPWRGQLSGVTVTVGASPDQQRAEIIARSGQKRGSPGALLDAVRAALTGQKRVSLVERDTSAYHATLTTYSADTPDVAKVRAAVAAAKPARIIVDVQVLSGSSYNHFSAAHGPSFSSDQTAFPLIQDMIRHDPEPGTVL